MDHDFYRSKTSNSLTIGVSSGSYNLYRPSLFYLLRATWNSTYSERRDTYSPPADIVFYDGGNCDSSTWTQAPNADGTPRDIGTSSMGSWSNRISSVKIPAGFYVDFYDGDLSGDFITLQGKSDVSGVVCQKLTDYSYSNIASSLRLYQRINGAVEEQFIINFEDPCLWNQLSLDTDLEDVTYNVVSNSVSRYSIDYSTTVSESVCPLTATCYIYSELKDEWITCDNAPSGPYNTKDAKASRWFNAFDSSYGHLDVLYTLANYRADHSSPFPDVEYQIKIRIEDPKSDVANNFVEDIFTMTVKFKCAHDTITHSSSQSQFSS